MQSPTPAKKLLMKRQLTKQLSNTLADAAKAAISPKTSNASRTSSVHVVQVSLSRSSTTHSRKSESSVSVFLKKDISASELHLSSASAHTASGSSGRGRKSTDTVITTSHSSLISSNSIPSEHSMRAKPFIQASNASARSAKSAALTSQASNASVRSAKSAALTSQASNASARSAKSAALATVGSNLSSRSISMAREVSTASARSRSRSPLRSVTLEAAPLPCLEAGMVDVALIFDLTEGMKVTLQRSLSYDHLYRQRLKQLLEDYPNSRVAVILHADVGNEYRACIKTFSSVVEDIVQFVSAATAELGDDLSDAWFRTDSLIIDLALNKLAWDPSHPAVVVMVADVMPHDVYYYLTGHDDRDIIDWKTYSDALLAMGVRLFAVQMYEDAMSADFWREWLRITDGTHVLLSPPEHFQLSNILAGICYNALGKEAFEMYEQQLVRENQANESLLRQIRPFGANSFAAAVPLPGPSQPLGGAFKRKRKIEDDELSSCSGSISSASSKRARVVRKKARTVKRVSGAAKRARGAAKGARGAAKRARGAAKKPRAARKSKGAAKKALPPRNLPIPTAKVLQILSKGFREDVPHRHMKIGGPWTAWRPAYLPHAPSKAERERWTRMEKKMVKWDHPNKHVKLSGFRAKSMRFSGRMRPGEAFFYEFAVRPALAMPHFAVAFAVIDTADKVSQDPDEVLLGANGDSPKLLANLALVLDRMMPVFVRRCAIRSDQVATLRESLCYAWHGAHSHACLPRLVRKKRHRVSCNIFY